MNQESKTNQISEHYVEYKSVTRNFSWTSDRKFGFRTKSFYQIW